ncbi:MAG: acyl-CoA thioesterase [Bacteroidales bacterium]|nr:acyl-CoA thioesterase [Bacteroidales bacterium]
MIVKETNIRVPYGHTDQMGFVYYGNYPLYYEIGRTESLRSMATSYKALEDDNILMPVIDMNIKYVKPARYDDLLTIRTIVKELPSTRMKFFYEIYNQSVELLNLGETTLIFLSQERNRPVRCPDWMLDIFKKEMVKA